MNTHRSFRILRRSTLAVLLSGSLFGCGGGGKAGDQDIGATSADTAQTASILAAAAAAAAAASDGDATTTNALGLRPTVLPPSRPTPVAPPAAGIPATASPDSVWYQVALEGEMATVNAPAHVRFGTPEQWVYADANGSFTCDVSFFKKDPNPGVYKQCHTDDPSARSKNVKVMTIGDSITGFYRYGLLPAVTSAGFTHVDWVGNAMYSYHGRGELDPDSNGYGGYKGFSLLKAAGTGADALGVTPGTAWGFLHADERDLGLWFQGQSPDIVLLMLGTNDCNLDADQAQQAAKELQVYSRVLAAARAANPSVRLFVAQIPPAATCESWDAQLNAVIPFWALANTTVQSPVTVVDQYTGFDASMTRDGVHPSDPMIEKMGARWLTAIRPYLR